MSNQPTQRLGGNLILASLLAILSYVPFELVAKIGLVFCALLFVFDPIPPLSRLLSLITLMVIAGLSKLYRQHQEVMGQEGEVEVVASSAEEAEKATDENKKKDQ